MPLRVVRRAGFPPAAALCPRRTAARRARGSRKEAALRLARPRQQPASRRHRTAAPARRSSPASGRCRPRSLAASVPRGGPQAASACRSERVGSTPQTQKGSMRVIGAAHVPLGAVRFHRHDAQSSCKRCGLRHDRFEDNYVPQCRSSARPSRRPRPPAAQALHPASVIALRGAG